MKLKILLCGLLILIAQLCTAFSENHEWSINYSLKNSSTFTGVSKADSMYIISCDNHDSDPSLRQIIKSTNGGLTWKMVYNFNDNSLGWYEVNNIDYPTKNFCIASCDSNYFIKTTDGGETWTESSLNMDYFIRGLDHISLLDSLYGIMGTHRNIAYSDDGFNTYKVLVLPRPLIIARIKLISPTVLYVLTASPASFFKYDVSTDIWTEYPESFPSYDPEYKTPRYMFFSDSLYGYVVGNRRSGIGNASYDMIHKTTDGGKTWVEKFNALITPRGGLTEVDFCDKENGIAVGPQGKIYWTHDAGETWSQDSSKEIIKAQSAVLHVTILNKSTAIIADFEGNLWRTPIGTDVPERIMDDEAMIYPNPVRDFLSINISEIKKVEIYSVIGIKLLESEYKDKIDVSGLAPGMYFVRIGDKVSKFVKL